MIGNELLFSTMINFEGNDIEVNDHSRMAVLESFNHTLNDDILE